jgi:hypothetical protein
MIEFTGHWEGIEGLGEAALAELRPRAEHAVTQAANLFSNELKLTLTGQRHGREYRVSMTGKVHIASAPGEPPAVLYGNLRNSVGFSKPVWNGNTLEAEVGIGLGVNATADRTAASYAALLEFGGMTGRGHRSYVAPRPYIEPTAVRTEEPITRLLELTL